MTLALAADPVFYSSTPATRPSWGQKTGSWRCSDREAATALVQSIAGPEAYTDHQSNYGGHTLAIHVAIRRNDSPGHAERLEALAVDMEALGYRVLRRNREWNGVKALDHLVLVDSMRKNAA